jgi:hypothetical protein
MHAINVWFNCLASNNWPGYPRGVQRITLPGWHQREWIERELEEESDG